ncbi:hypothetical protein BMS3Abin03_00819 [bacterium BMS3Abin03]|nr:hypothetical protein BMS3Abin03_00819 [bacterium BMS3Abin03]
MENNEKKYEDVIKTLKGLQQVKASPNFEAGLKRRLNEEKYSKEESFVKKFFVPSKLIISFGLAAALIMFFVFNPFADETENPFMMQPKVRENMIVVDYDMNTGMIDKKSLKNEEKMKRSDAEEEKDEMKMSEAPLMEKSLVEGEEPAPPESTVTDTETEVAATDEMTAPPRATGFAIRKSGLNFRQVKPTQEEQKEIQMLKKKIQVVQKKENAE